MTRHPAASADLNGKTILGVEIVGRDIALCKVGDAVFATGNICTHQHTYMTDGYLENGCIECPLHQAVFDVKTGEVLEGSAREPLPVYPVKMAEGQVWVELPD